MDIPPRDAYPRGMFDRIVTMLAVLVIAVVTAAASAHAARMTIEPSHAVHVGGMIHDADSDALSCDSERHCGSADAGLCELVCAGFSQMLARPGLEAEPAFRPAVFNLAVTETRAGRNPDLNERPPKRRLL